MRIVSVLGRFVYNFILFCALVSLFFRRSVFLLMFGNCIGTFFSPFSANTYLPYVLFLLRFRKWYIYGAILDLIGVAFFSLFAFFSFFLLNL